MTPISQSGANRLSDFNEASRQDKVGDILKTALMAYTE